MKYVDVVRHCMALAGVTRSTISASGNAFSFNVNNEVFAYFETGAPIQWRFSLRVTAQQYEELHYPPKVLQAKDKPGGPWLTIVRVESFDETLLVDLINASYQSTLAL